VFLSFLKICSISPFLFVKVTCIQYFKTLTGAKKKIKKITLFWRYWSLNSGPTLWPTPPALSCDGFFFEIGPQELFARSWLRTTILLISASWVARIAGKNYFLSETTFNILDIPEQLSWVFLTFAIIKTERLMQPTQLSSREGLFSHRCLPSYCWWEYSSPARPLPFLEHFSRIHEGKMRSVGTRLAHFVTV
jgi:hypothetical protein